MGSKKVVPDHGLFLENGSYKRQMSRTEGEVRSLKAACL